MRADEELLRGVGAGLGGDGRDLACGDADGGCALGAEARAVGKLRHAAATRGGKRRSAIHAEARLVRVLAGAAGAAPHVLALPAGRVWLILEESRGRLPGSGAAGVSWEPHGGQRGVPTRWLATAVAVRG